MEKRVEWQGPSLACQSICVKYGNTDNLGLDDDLVRRFGTVKTTSNRYRGTQFSLVS